MFFQVGSVGPMFGQYGHFHRYADGQRGTYAHARYVKETRRLLEVDGALRRPTRRRPRAQPVRLTGPKTYASALAT